MKANVLFDASGNVLSMLHSPADAGSGKGQSEKQMRVAFRPSDKQQTATLEIPADLQHLKPSQLHKSVHVDRSGAAPRLVAKDKS